mmetsp:Transcript_54262/g.140090  ORF Transcript_54262/g.140090 Transcript_54262/m.140090 type:complete len:203 (-) Transcript_54262:469-1077(-)
MDVYHFAPQSSADLYHAASSSPGVHVLGRPALRHLRSRPSQFLRRGRVLDLEEPPGTDPGPLHGHTLHLRIGRGAEDCNRRPFLARAHHRSGAHGARIRGSHLGRRRARAPQLWHLPGRRCGHDQLQRTGRLAGSGSQPMDHPRRALGVAHGHCHDHLPLGQLRGLQAGNVAAPWRPGRKLRKLQRRRLRRHDACDLQAHRC